MKQHLFEQRHNADWQRFETRLHGIARGLVGST